MKKITGYKSFADDLEAWLAEPKPKTLLEINEVFGDKSFGLLCLILMSVPALPLPTGGVTHVFELIVMALALLFIIGRSDIPRRWHNKTIPLIVQTKTLPFLLRRIRMLERFSQPRLSRQMKHWFPRAIIGLCIFVFTLTAFLAPPFSGLDTLPSIGVMIIALGLILEDFLFILAGIVVGGGGVILIIAIGTALARFTWSLL